jgi:hypothetical protein
MEIAIITLIINGLLICLKEGPDALAAIKQFIEDLNKTNWTEEEIRALVAKTRRPAEYT